MKDEKNKKNRLTESCVFCKLYIRAVATVIRAHTHTRHQVNELKPSECLEHENIANASIVEPMKQNKNTECLDLNAFFLIRC